MNQLQGQWVGGPVTDILWLVVEPSPYYDYIREK